VPRLAAQVELVRQAGGRVDIVVLLCGLNDVKRASPWRTPIGFRRDLAELVGEIQGSCGAETTVVLPALPLHLAPVFSGQWPLLPLLSSFAGLWDEQKKRLSDRELSRVWYVRSVEADSDLAAQNMEAAYWADDGIHPNDAGYKLWGEHIGRGVMRHLEERQGGLPSRPREVA